MRRVLDRPAWAAVLAVVLPILLAALFRPVPVSAQRTVPDPELRRIESLIQQNRMDQARDALGHWNDAHPSTGAVTPGNDRAHAWVLRARLARDWDSAEQAWVAVALGYPVSSHAPEALLRLGQGLLTAARAGQADANSRAIAYLDRLITDYPNAHHRADAFLWLARALDRAGRRGAACNRLTEARTFDADSATAAMIRHEATRLCSR